MTAKKTQHIDTDLSALTAMPLGATPMTVAACTGVSFAVRAPLASSLTLCLFDDDERESCHAMQVDDDGVWHCWVADVPVGTRYGFRADGAATATQPFNPQKLLLDPYGKGVDGKPLLVNDDDYHRLLFSDDRDNADIAPKSIVVNEAFDWGDDEYPQTPWSETIIYELHVKGFTRLNLNIPAALRGSYAALATPQVTDYLQALGITAVELMPVAYGVDEPHLQHKGLTNYWNYNTLSPFAVERNYWSGRHETTPLTEFKQAVKALHAAGIEVILDVVFNHSAEAEQHHPGYCQRGLANADFYWLADDGSTINHTGCGNTINAKHPATRQWIIDCLCYWVESCHVDGFRFDLASVLGREPDFNTHAAFFQALADEPLLYGIKLIAEPWDIGDNGYQLGHFPTSFAEWNDRFRDDSRAFFNHQDGKLGAFADRLAGSSAIFNNHRTNQNSQNSQSSQNNRGTQADDKKKNKTLRLPHHSINLITAHDGFTLADVVAYNAKHNHDNGEDNRDGHDHNLSDNHGVEGETDDKAIQALRQQTQRALLATLLLANGTPMLLAGDEIGHSQNGNNNAYCQDNEMTWIDWSQADTDLRDYVATLIRYRKIIPSLQADAWWTDDNVAWLTPDGQPMAAGDDASDWHNASHKALQVQLDDHFLLLVNGKRQAQSFVLPQPSADKALDDKALDDKALADAVSSGYWRVINGNSGNASNSNRDIRDGKYQETITVDHLSVILLAYC